MSQTQQLERRTAFARRMGITPETVSRWLKKGEHGLKPVMVGRLVYVDASNFQFNAAKPAATTAGVSPLPSTQLATTPQHNYLGGLCIADCCRDDLKLLSNNDENTNE